MSNAEEKVIDAKTAETRINLQIRMQAARDREKYHDIFFKIGDPALEGDLSKFERIGTIRAVVASSSAVFDAMLYGNLMEGRPGVDVEITDVEPQIFHAVLDYIFTDSVKNISGRNVKLVHRVADKYDIAGLQKVCLKYIRDNRLIVEILLDENFRKYHGAYCPPRALLEKVVYFRHFTFRDFREAVSEQFSIAEDRLEFWGLSGGTICAGFQFDQGETKLETVFTDHEIDCSLYVRVLSDNEEVGFCYDTHSLLVFKYFDDVRMSLQFVGTRLVKNSPFVRISDIFEAFVSLTEGDFHMFNSCFKVRSGTFFQRQKSNLWTVAFDGDTFIFTNGYDEEGFKKFHKLESTLRSTN